MTQVRAQSTDKVSSGGSKAILESDAAGDDSSTPSMAASRNSCRYTPQFEGAFTTLGGTLTYKRRSNGLLILHWQLLKGDIQGLGPALSNSIVGMSLPVGQDGLLAEDFFKTFRWAQNMYSIARSYPPS